MDQPHEQSGMHLSRRQEKIPRGTLTKSFFVEEDIEDYDFEKADEPSSPTKMLPKDDPNEKKPEKQMRRSMRRGKRNIVLEPLKAAKPKKVQIQNIDSEGSQHQNKQVQLMEELTLEQHSPVDESSKTEEKKQVREKKESGETKQIKKKEKNNVLFIDEESDEEPEPNQESLMEMRKVEEEQPREGNVSTLKKLESLGKEFEYIKDHNAMCFVIRRDKQWFNRLRPVFNLFHQQSNKYFFSAKMTGSNTTQTFAMSRNREDFTQNSPGYLGKIKGNFMGNQIFIFGPGYSPTDAKTKNLPLRDVLASVSYETNFFGSTKPRNFRVYLLRPSASYYSLRGAIQYEQEKSLQQLYKIEENRKNIIVLTNKKPEWSDQINGYMLNFGGKVKKASIKNFILEDENNPQNTRMLFGKIDEDEFRMDIGNPLSPFVGLGIALSAFGSKIGCQ